MSRRQTLYTRKFLINVSKLLDMGYHESTPGYSRTPEEVSVRASKITGKSVKLVGSEMRKVMDSYAFRNQ